MRPRSLLAAILAAVVLISGCASIPKDGSVGHRDVSGDDPHVQSRIDPDGPVPGQSPNEIVRGFLAAGAGYSNNFEVARSYLTDSFAGEWNPLSSVTVLQPGRTLDSVTSEVTTDSQSVSLTIPVGGVLDDRRIYRESARGTQVDMDFTLRQVNGEWRISQAPAGMVLTAVNFSTLFQPYPLYFYSPGYELLVPDTRWFIRSPSTASEIMTELLGGPADYLTGAVVSAIPDGTQLDPRSVAVSDGVARVELSATASGLDERTNGRIAMQIQATLKEVGSITAARVSGTSGELDYGSLPDVPTTLNISGNPIAISDRRLVRILGTTIEPIDGAPQLVDGAARPAIALDESMYAYIADDAQAVRRLFADRLNDEEVLRGESYASLSFDKAGWLWAAETASDGNIQAISRNGDLTEAAVPFLGGRTVTSIGVSPDGTRLAVLSSDGDDTRLEVVGISRDSQGAPTGVSSATPLQVATGFSKITDFSWFGYDALVLLGAEQGTSVEPLSVPVSGPSTSLGSIEGGTQITSGEEQRSVRVGTADGEIYSYGAGSWQKLVDAQTYDPAAPG